jgi:diaminopimelate dehydrogenase
LNRSSDRSTGIPFEKEGEIPLSKIRIGIAGYGNLGRGVELAVAQNPDMELAGVFTRRDPSRLIPADQSAPVYSIGEAASMRNKIDVMILCGGSATDLPTQGPAFAALFNTVDSFDTHAKIPQYFLSIHEAAMKNGHVSIVSVGWDPGMFSLNRLYAESILPSGVHYTFWGKGVSQGHSDAIRRIEGVKNAVQYTVPVQSAIEAVRSGANPGLTTREKHTRECYVVPEEGADKTKIKKTIENMQNYFADYDTVVHFISEHELKANHGKMPHGGFVVRSGSTGEHHKHIIEYSLKLDSNPEFTAGVLVCYARAAYRMARSGEKGARTVFDIPPALLSPKSGEELRAELL